MMRVYRRWWLAVVLVGVACYALAEDLTLTTYYPSPRGVYKELRAQEQLAVGGSHPGDSNDQPIPARLIVAGSPATNPLDVGGNPGPCPPGTDWYDTDADGAREAGECFPTGLLVTTVGRVGIGTTSPATTLDMAGALSMRGTENPGTAPGGQGRLYFDASLNKFRISEHGGNYRDLGGTSWNSWTVIGWFNGALDGCMAGFGCDTGITVPDDREVFYAVMATNVEMTFLPPAVPAYWVQNSMPYSQCLYGHPFFVPPGSLSVCGMSYDLYSILPPTDGLGNFGPISLITMSAGSMGYACQLRFDTVTKHLLVQGENLPAQYTHVDCFVAAWQR